MAFSESAINPEIIGWPTHRRHALELRHNPNRGAIRSRARSIAIAGTSTPSAGPSIVRTASGRWSAQVGFRPGFAARRVLSALPGRACAVRPGPPA
jgi:hypothetical protein